MAIADASGGNNNLSFVSYPRLIHYEAIPAGVLRSTSGRGTRQEVFSRGPS